VNDPAPTSGSQPGATRRGWSADDPDDSTSALAARFRTLADQDFAGYSPTYERIARAIADDPDSLGLLLDAAPTGRTPILALAAVHDIVLGDPQTALAAVYAGRSDADPWPAFRSLLHDRQGDVLQRMRTRAIQTNEVGRSAALVPGMAAVAGAARRAGDERPLALVEVGTSAGLNLLFDHYSIDYRRDGEMVHRAGPPTSPVRLDCELRGPHDPPFASHGPTTPVASRLGLDLAPVDVTDDAACRWLRACLWPDVSDRAERLDAAISVARTDPPHLVEGDAVTELAPTLRALPAGVLPVVVATWALAYLGRAGRERLLVSLDEVGATTDLVLLTAEEPSAAPWVPGLPAEVATCGDATGDGTTTVLGARTWRAGAATDEALALCHPHVRWMAWATLTGGPR
jgi:hypothetical protein